MCETEITSRFEFAFLVPVVIVKNHRTIKELTTQFEILRSSSGRRLTNANIPPVPAKIIRLAAVSRFTERFAGRQSPTSCSGVGCSSCQNRQDAIAVSSMVAFSTQRFQFQNWVGFERDGRICHRRLLRRTHVVNQNTVNPWDARLMTQRVFCQRQPL